VKSINSLTIAQFQYVNIINNWMNDNNKLSIDNDNIIKVLESAGKRNKTVKKNQENKIKSTKSVSVITSRFKHKNKTFKSTNKVSKRKRTEFYKKLLKKNNCLFNVLK
jgi:hypothetical protein